MRLVVQEDAFGCAVACVASVLNLSYKDALKLFPKGKKRATLTGFYCKDIVAILEMHQKNYKIQYIKKRKTKKYKTGSIVYVGKSKKYLSGHYLLKTDSGWMNPWINFPYKPRIAGINKRLPGKSSYIVLPGV